MLRIGRFGIKTLSIGFFAAIAGFGFKKTHHGFTKIRVGFSNSEIWFQLQ